MTSGERSAPVSKILKSRRDSGSKPGARDDRRYVALIIEGGSMRGVVSAGMVAGLEQLGMRDCFDVVYGSSAGAISGAYFIAGQARYGTTIFYEDINNAQFISFRRLFSSSPVMSLEYLLDDVCVRRKPLIVDRVLSSDIPLRIVASSIAGKAVVIRNCKNPTELFQALRASARVPFFAGPPVEFNGDRLLDATIYDSIPFRTAIADGATDLVVLLTRPAGQLRHAPNWIDRILVARHLRRLNADLYSAYLARAQLYKDEMDAIRAHSSGRASPPILAIQIPSEAVNVGLFERSRGTLVQGAKSGFRAVYTAMGLPVPEAVEIITAFRDGVADLAESKLFRGPLDGKE